jgi:hypothetical protein
MAVQSQYGDATVTGTSQRRSPWECLDEQALYKKDKTFSHWNVGIPFYNSDNRMAPLSPQNVGQKGLTNSF